jgi:hypothetical protein
MFAIFGFGAIGVGGIGVISYWLFKLFSEKWLNAKFEERLASYKHEQQKELEQLRFKINALMDRTTKLHQREFEVLPEAWSKLVDANAHVYSAVAALQQYPDVDRMSDQQLDELLKKSTFTDWQKDELRRATNKSDYYIRAITFKRLFEAQNVFFEFQTYLFKNGIFIREELKVKFYTLKDIIHKALIEHEISQREKISMWTDIKKLTSEGQQLLKSLEQDVQKRLWDSQV